MSKLKVIDGMISYEMCLSEIKVHSDKIASGELSRMGYVCRIASLRAVLLLLEEYVKDVVVFDVGGSGERD